MGVDHDYLIRDAQEFFDGIPDIVLQTVGEHTGLGTKEELGAADERLHDSGTDGSACNGEDEAVPGGATGHGARSTCEQHVRPPRDGNGEHTLQTVQEQHHGDHGVQMGGRCLCHNHQSSKRTGGEPPDARGAGGRSHMRLGNPPDRLTAG